jgi:hypothetical protein
MKTQTQFKFTTESLMKFDSIFDYLGTMQEGVWLYENPFAKKDPLRYDKANFIVQCGNGGVMYIGGFSTMGMTFDQIVDRLKTGRTQNTNQKTIAQ